MAKSAPKKKAKKKAKESETLVITKDEFPKLKRGLAGIPVPRLDTTAQKPARRMSQEVFDFA